MNLGYRVYFEPCRRDVEIDMTKLPPDGNAIGVPSSAVAAAGLAKLSSATIVLIGHIRERSHGRQKFDHLKEISGILPIPSGAISVIEVNSNSVGVVIAGSFLEPTHLFAKAFRNSFAVDGTGQVLFSPFLQALNQCLHQ